MGEQKHPIMRFKYCTPYTRVTLTLTVTIHSIRMTNFDEVIVITSVISLLHKLQNHIDGEMVKPKTIKLVFSASPLRVFVDRIYPSSINFLYHR
jgi:hypothetical protein